MKSYKYHCIRTQQRPDADTPEFLLFVARAAEIYEWAAIERYTHATKKGPQRLQKPAKVSELKRFLEVDPRNTLPTSLLVSLRIKQGWLRNDNIAFPQCYTLEFALPEEGEESAAALSGEVEGAKPGMIIDGQHRLLGARAFSPDLMLNVVALINPSDDETAFQFLVVNNKASKVSSNHLKALSLNYKEDKLGDRLRSVRMSIGQHLNFVGFIDKEMQSPFRGKIAWSDNPPETGFVAPAAIKSAIAYIKQKRVPELEEDSILLAFFYAIWNPIAEEWKDSFNGETNLLKKVSILCLTEFLVDNIVLEYDNQRLDITDLEALSEQTRHLLKSITPKLWEVDWIAKSLDTGAGRTLVRESIILIRRNINAGREWYEDVPIVDMQGL